jgi:carbohydrate-binding DOMON domain-containing protein
MLTQHKQKEVDKMLKGDQQEFWKAVQQYKKAIIQMEMDAAKVNTNESGAESSGSESGTATAKEKQGAWETLIDYPSWDPRVEFKVSREAVYGFLLSFKSKESYAKTYAKAFAKYKALSQDDIKLSITSLRDSLLPAKHGELKAKLTLILKNWPQIKK